MRLLLALGLRPRLETLLDRLDGKSFMILSAPALTDSPSFMAVNGVCVGSMLRLIN
jgi:hypothetical protein